jgi:hypothetical protein
LKPADTWPRDRCGRAQLVLLPSLADSLRLGADLWGLLWNLFACSTQRREFFDNNNILYLEKLSEMGPPD